MPCSKKTDRELPIVPPIDFCPVSNGEFSPRPPDPRMRRAERLWYELVEEKHRRLGMTRRQFAESACGMATALYVINLVGCGSSGKAAGGGGAGAGGGAGQGASSGAGTEAGAGREAGTGGSAGRSAGAGGGGSGGEAGSGGRSGSGSGSGGEAGYDVDAGMMEDGGMARDRLDGDEFILDVQTHVNTPLEPWTSATPPELALDFITQVFVQSDTTVACVTGIPSVRNLGAPAVEAHAMLQALVERFGGPRLIFHANADPERGASELDYMAELADRYTIGAFKTYPFAGDLRLDSDEVGSPFIERAASLGVRTIAAHRGISGGGGYDVAGSPVDVVRAAKKFPNVNFLVYHSGWESSTDEDHPYDPDETDPLGVDRFIRALIENDVGPGGNVYAELGSTFYNVMNSPAQAAHVLGKLLKQLGPERVLYGTDSVFNGIPQAQIAGLRTLVIPESMQEQFGYPALADSVRARIFGLNAASVYGIDPTAVRYAITADDVEQLRLAYHDDPRSVPVPHRHAYRGPRTRREFLNLLRREGLTHGNLRTG
jgi:predicted TIM-barrel fold metal-dependent hydrolase